MTKPSERLAGITAVIQAEQLEITGTLLADPSDNLHHSIRSLVLLSPAAGFWDHFTQSPEHIDGQPDPLDRWSRRIIGHIACAAGARAYFPFGGPPFRPFLRWAQRSGRAWRGPVGPLVHETQGLVISYRGALGLPESLSETLPAQTGIRPCDTCAAPCLTACPVSALSAAAYDVPKCKAFLDTAPGSGCMEAGCLVRRACPVGQNLRHAKQLAFHMKAFNPK